MLIDYIDVNKADASQTLYRHVDPQERLPSDSEKLLCRRHTGRKEAPPGACGAKVDERHA